MTGKVMNQKTKNIQKTTTIQLATRRNGINSCLLALSGCAFSLAPLQAGVLFTFSEENGGVVARTSGTIASGWSRDMFISTPSSDAGVVTYDGIRGTQSGGIVYYSSGLWTLSEMSTRDPFNTDGVASGDTFGYAGSGNFYVPAGTAVGDEITPDTTITWAGESFESLGLDTGLSTTPLVVFTLDNSETISAVRSGSSGVSAIPEPSSMLSLAGLITGSAFLRRRKRA